MNSYLEGRIFKHGGRSYLVTKDNDWSKNTVTVKTVDRTRALKEFPISTVIRHAVQVSGTR